MSGDHTVVTTGTRFSFCAVVLLFLGAVTASAGTEKRFVPPQPLPQSEFQMTKYTGWFIEGYRQGAAFARFVSASEAALPGHDQLSRVASRRAAEIYGEWGLNPSVLRGFVQAYRTGAREFVRGSIRPSMQGYLDCPKGNP